MYLRKVSHSIKALNSGLVTYNTDKNWAPKKKSKFWFNWKLEMFEILFGWDKILKDKIAKVNGKQQS